MKKENGTTWLENQCVFKRFGRSIGVAATDATDLIHDDLPFFQCETKIIWWIDDQ